MWQHNLSIMTKIIGITLLAVVFSCKQDKKSAVKPMETININEIMDSEVTSKFSIEILDDAAKEILDPNAEIAILAESSFEWTEGPLYIEDGDYLLFSDIPNKRYTN